MNRRTSSYMLEVFADPGTSLTGLADNLVENYPDDVEASGTNRAKGSAFIRFRLADVEAAKAVARELSFETPYILSVGYGIGWTLIEDTRSWSPEQPDDSKSGRVE